MAISKQRERWDLEKDHVNIEIFTTCVQAPREKPVVGVIREIKVGLNFEF